MKFILQILDSSTECPTREMELEVNDPFELGSMLCIPAFDADASYDLNRFDLARIHGAYAIALNDDDIFGRLRLRRWFDDLPYRIHTDRELALMLAGTKPLASFVEAYHPNPQFDEIPEKRFDPYVEAGKFIKREFVELISRGRVRCLRRILYSLTSESWRIDAYILLLQIAGRTGWNEALERFEGALLGYEEWQSDAYFAARRAMNIRS